MLGFRVACQGTYQLFIAFLVDLFLLVSISSSLFAALLRGCGQGLSQMQTVQQVIDRVTAEIQETKQELAAAEQAGDGPKVDFLREKDSSMRRELCSLREQQTILLRAQAPGCH
ncbi:hypothetical protein WJX77_005907 [Trebouxia sp. C0004]